MNDPQDPLNEREFELVNIVGAELADNQRDLSRHMNLSLGMTNMVLRRLITKGYIRIKQLDRRKVEYILTPKGFAEKMRKSVKYTLKTIHSIGLIKNNLFSILKPLHDEGIRKFYILGESDLAALIEIVFKENSLNDYTLAHIKDKSEAPKDGAILICTEEVEGTSPNGQRVINVLESLASQPQGVH
jgi:DNA-binding MarR family transcriptional regulator